MTGSADWQSAVSRIGNPQTTVLQPRPADCQPAKPQVANLRYEGEDAACERCGSFDVLEISGMLLCADRVATAGCGCAGHRDSNED